MEDSNTPEIIADVSEVAWLYLLVGAPLLILFLKRGWNVPFEDGESFLFICALLIGAFTERAIEFGRRKYVDRKGMDRRDWLFGGYLLFLLLPVLGLSVAYVVQSPDVAHGVPDYVQIVWFFVAIAIALSVRFAAVPFPPDNEGTMGSPSRVVLPSKPD